MIYGNHDAMMGTYGRSSNLWSGIDVSRCDYDRSYGYAVVETFKPLRAGDYTVTQAGSVGTFTQSAGKYGGAAASSGSTTNGQGVNIQGPLIWQPSTSGMIVAEIIGTWSGNGTGPEFFWGLHESDTTIIASGALSSDDYVGFFSADSNALTAVNRLNTAAAQSFSAGTIPIDGSVCRYGFKIRGTRKIEFYVNNVLLSTTPVISIPTGVNLAWSLVVQSNGTTTPIFTPREAVTAFLENEI